MKLSGVNQLWVAGTTCIRPKQEWMYLAVILDAFSRKVVGWKLDRNLTARLPIAALEKAIAEDTALREPATADIQRLRPSPQSPPSHGAWMDF